MSVLHHHVPAMQHAATLMDPINVHVTTDLAEMEQLVLVGKYLQNIQLMNYRYYNVILVWIISNAKF